MAILASKEGYRSVQTVFIKKTGFLIGLLQRSLCNHVQLFENIFSELPVLLFLKNTELQLTTL
ncbi:hypothetical protein [Paenibacillus typhae]|uniref:hypothetical protein n=1 Tax=Paenibacillus typhae TaxID=1174501 RepID=UPI001C8E92D6|nr:hypothetical protein [Paenibacillus typhae]